MNDISQDNNTDRKQSSISRTLQRYFIPRFVVSIIYYLRDKCLISTQSRVQLSDQITFGRGTVVKPFAVIQTQGGKISFGEGCAVSSFNHISTGLSDVVIGDFVRLGPNVTIMGGSRNFKTRAVRIIDQGSYHKPVNIGDDVLIGTSAVIMPGSNIGKGAVIGAMSLVNGDVAPYSIVAGVPAQMIGERS